MKKLVIALGALVGLFAILGVIAPTDLEIEREILIEKPISLVFSDLKLLKNHDHWSPWVKRDLNMAREFKGTDGTVGFISAWSGNDQVGVGEQEIKAIAEGSRIDYELRFKEPMEDTSTAYLVTEATAMNQTRVRWGMKGKTPFPGNVICFIMNTRSQLTKDFDEGLSSLKTYLEKQ